MHFALFLCSFMSMRNSKVKSKGKFRFSWGKKGSSKKKTMYAARILANFITNPFSCLFLICRYQCRPCLQFLKVTSTKQTTRYQQIVCYVQGQLNNTSGCTNILCYGRIKPPNWLWPVCVCGQNFTETLIPDRRWAGQRLCLHVITQMGCCMPTVAAPTWDLCRVQIRQPLPTAARVHTQCVQLVVETDWIEWFLQAVTFGCCYAAILM